MVICGRVLNGVVVLEGGPALPEGTEVIVACKTAPKSKKQSKGKRVRFPIIRSKHPGSIHLTGERIAEILDEEDASPRH